ncbi:MAG: transglutaminase domain-containing protein [Deltaproteobacteria bacterium]|nr:transglutaminase domain-containing protein [Deltaproteobacteria bacterium]
MWRRLAGSALVVLCCALMSCGPKPERENPSTESRAVTAEIQAGIEKHIDEESRAHDGYFPLVFRDVELRLKLVRVHIEYLASLGPLSNFACVDLVDTDGEVYDVDFFMEGPPDNMTVTETTVHKINGQPLYAWEQQADRTWHRVPIDEASSKLQGVVEDRDEFEFLYRVDLPEMAEPARMWLPIPITDAFQTVKSQTISAPGQQSFVEEAEHGNKILMLELSPKDSGKRVELRFEVERIEKAAYADALPDGHAYLEPDRLVPLDGDFAKLGAEAVAGKQGEMVRARALYDHVIDRMSYKRVGEGWGEGNAIIACDTRTGNCSDFHAYFIAVARAVGIPARFGVGASIPSARDEGGISGYHCWAEFYAEGKWWPVDISEGDKYSNLSTYYFGHHPANRIELSRGRDLVFEPGPQSGPVNFLAYPLLEVGGQPVRTKPVFSFKRTAKQ